MGQYKVPQDVEAEDKLIGWLSFRQLIYAGVAAGAATLTVFVFPIFPPLIIATLPITLIFGILILPLRKDQPLETYLLGVVRFYLKPKTRKWDPDGVNYYVEITAPKQEDRNLAKTYGAETAQERLDYLARIMDSRGWAYKQVDGMPSSTNLSADIAAEATTAVDVLDEHASVSQSFKSLITRNDEERRQTIMERMQKIQEEPGIGGPPPTITNVKAATDDDYLGHPTFNPYPSSMHQKVISPSGSKPKTPPKQAKAQMTPKVSPGIISLANNEGLSVSAIANEAKRLEEKEVVIKLH